MAISSTPDSKTQVEATEEETFTEPWNPPMTRGGLLRTGAAAAAAGGAAATLGKAGVAQAAGGGKNKWKKRRFRALVKIDGTPAIHEVELTWPLHPRQVIVAVESTQISYSNAWEAYKAPNFGNPGQRPFMLGYISVGKIVYVGEHVRRVQVGDSVVLGVTPQCGQCYNCLHNRPDMCQFMGGSDDDPAIQNPRFTLVSDGRPVDGFRGGFGELNVTTDNYVVPLFTDISASALSLLGSVGVTGLAPPTVFTPVAPGSDVAVFGCGPIGLSAVNGAAIMGADRIVAIDPIAYRREAALKVGATAVVNPTGKDATLVAELREMFRGRTERRFAGGHPRSNGPDFILEATGSQEFDPSTRGIEPQPDPLGLREMLQIIELCPSYGTIVTTGVRWSGGTFAVPAGQMGPNGKRWITAQMGGAGLTRDLPRMVNMMERGQYKWEELVSAEYPLEQWKQALDETAYRQKISNHIVFDPSQFLD